MMITKIWFTWRHRKTLEPVISTGPEMVWEDYEQALERADWFWNELGEWPNEFYCSRDEAVLCRVEEHVHILEMPKA